LFEEPTVLILILSSKNVVLTGFLEILQNVYQRSTIRQRHPAFFKDGVQCFRRPNINIVFDFEAKLSQKLVARAVTYPKHFRLLHKLLLSHLLMQVE